MIDSSSISRAYCVVCECSSCSNFCIYPIQRRLPAYVLVLLFHQCNRAIIVEHFCTSRDLIITELLPKLQQVQLNIRHFLCAFTITNAVDCFQFEVSSATKKLLTTSLSSIIRDTHLLKVQRKFFQKCFSLIIVEI